MRSDEADLQSAVLDLCKRLGLYAYHTHNSRRSQRGFPDLVIIGFGGVLWRELKSATGRPTTEQLAVLARLTAAGQDAGIWRPADLMSGAIGRQLTALRRRPGDPMRRPEVHGQIPAFNMQPPEPPKTPKQKPLRPDQVRYVRFKPRVRTLCHDCVRDIHERGVHIAPPPLTVSWKRHTADGIDLICEQHKRQEHRDG